MGLTALIATTEFIDILERKKRCSFYSKKAKTIKKRKTCMRGLDGIVCL